MISKVTCPNCESDGVTFYLQDKDRKLVRCQDCLLTFVSPLPTPQSLKKIYDQKYFDQESDSGYTAYTAMSEFLLNVGQERLEFVQKFKKNGKILDVGCATGEFLLAAKKGGWETVGVEVSRYASNLAQKKGLKVINGLLGDLIKQKNVVKDGFDVITLWDVIEHFSNPGQELKLFHILLKPEGILIIGTPNKGSLRSKIEQKKWWAYFVSREHLFYFDKNTLSAILLKNNFKPIYSEAIARDFSLKEFILFLLSIGNITLNPSPVIDHFHHYQGIKGKLKKIFESLNLGHVLIMVAKKI